MHRPLSLYNESGRLISLVSIFLLINCIKLFHAGLYMLAKLSRVSILLRYTQKPSQPGICVWGR